MQKSPARVPLTRPVQHASPAPPHEPTTPAQLPLLAQTPAALPHVLPPATQPMPVQQAPGVVPVPQPFSAQQGWPAAPHATGEPPRQMVPVPVDSPAAMQLPLWQQPPPLHTLFGQHWVPGAPQMMHVVPLQVPPLPQVVPEATQMVAPGSQHPELHTFPAQHGWPAPPHAWQTLFAQAVPDAMQKSCAQQGSPAAPHAAQVPLLHATLPAVHWLPVQHGWPEPPQFPQLPEEQLPPMLGHADPAATQVLLTQQPPPAQLEAGQQGWPGPPH